MLCKNSILRQMGKKRDDAAALFLGAFGIGLILGAMKPRCPNPNCNRSIPRGISICPHCDSVLEWK
jgi:hypothetical protein